MRPAPGGPRLVFAASLVFFTAGFARPEMQYTLSDGYTAGPGGYACNNLYFSASPDPGFSLDIYWGRTKVSEPMADTTSSLGFGGWIELTRKLDLSVDYNTYNGARAGVLRVPDMTLAGERPDRQKVGTLSGTLGLDLMKDAGQGEDGESTPDARAKLYFGASSAIQTMPVFIERFAPVKGVWVERELEPYAVHDTGFSAGLTLGMGATTLSATHLRHHYSYPAPPKEASKEEISRILDSITTASIRAFPPFPRYESGVRLSQGLPMRLGASISFEYILTELNRQVSRIITGELSWEAYSWLELRAGSYWIHEYQRTTRYTTAGVSLYF